jgi:hypothetical protein
MKRIMSTILAISFVAPTLALAQVAPPSGQKSLAATLDVYAFPTKGQSSSQQSEDEAACYQFAVTNTGTNPFQLSQQAGAQQQQAAAAQQKAKSAGAGAGAAGAFGGAAAGAPIGGISGDAGKGAAWGAAAGLLIGHRRRMEAQAQASHQAAQQSSTQQSATAEQMTNFKKAFSVCLQAKNYMVQY